MRRLATPSFNFLKHSRADDNFDSTFTDRRQSLVETWQAEAMSRVQHFYLLNIGSIAQRH